MEGPAAGQPSSSRKVKRVKTFTGCWGCRTRKIKCDEATPECSQCQKAGIKCAGYDSTLVWIHPGQETYPAGRRRALQYDLTWSRSPTYGSDDINALIIQCDLPESQQTSQSSSTSKSAGPFTVFPIMTKSNQLHPDIERAMKQSHSPRLLSEPDGSTSYLLHHYTIHVAPNMMPFKDPRNPWQSSYPLLPRCGDSAGHRSLFHAILAQAAGNLAHLGVDKETYKALNMEHYARSIEELRKSISDEGKDFSIALASMLTLVVAEDYSGDSNAWRLHLNGAWDLFKSFQSRKPWLDNDFAWVTTQSLCLLKIKSDRTTQEEQNVISSVAERSDFGFTTGATPELMACVMEIDDLHVRTKKNSYTTVLTPSLANLPYTIETLVQRIETCTIEPVDPIIRTHHRIFLLGTLIYAHRQLLNPPPSVLSSYLSTLLDCVALYPTLGGGHIALWPVFMAAVEVYLPEHKTQVREWMDRADAIGVTSRKNVRRLVEEVWITREHMASDEGVKECEIIVDWKAVMNRLGMDILLI